MKWYSDRSNIQGIGLFANKTLRDGEFIDIVIHYNEGQWLIRKDFGELINHSYKHNNVLVVPREDGNYWLMATKLIRKHDEILSNYDGPDIPVHLNCTFESTGNVGQISRVNFPVNE